MTQGHDDDDDDDDAQLIYGAALTFPFDQDTLLVILSLFILRLSSAESDQVSLWSFSWSRPRAR